MRKWKKLLVGLASFLGLMLAALAALLLWPLPEMPRNGVEGDFLIRNVSLVDVESGSVLPARDVVLRGGKIASVGQEGRASRDPSLIAIDGTGKFLMPGLWDMHAHSLKLSPQYMHPLFVANGITGVRDMSGCMSEGDTFFGCIGDRRRWNEALADGSGLSPRYVLQSSFAINGGDEVPDGYPEFFKARTPEEARRLVSFYREAGADFLKTYNDISPASYRALAEEARRQGLSLAGHRPLRVSLEQVLAAGQRSIEHPRVFLQECHAGAAAIRATSDPRKAYNAETRWRLVDDHDRALCAQLMAQMAASDTWWTPTLQVLQMNARAGDESFRSDARLKYIPFLFRNLMWMPDADAAAREPADASGRELYAAHYEMALDHVGQAHAAGVKILAGTDAGDTYVFPGFDMHDELVELVRAGLSPAAALRSATIDAAVFAGMEERFGSVAPGKAGDMILVDANPLEDIRNTREISGLFFSGRYFDRAALDQMLEFAEQQAGSVRTNLHLLWDGLNSPLLRVQAAD